MNYIPVLPLLLTVSLGVVLVAVYGGTTLVEQSFPSFSQPNSGGLFGWVDTLGQIITAVYGAVVYFVNLITFNIPGAPIPVRLVIGSVLGGGIVLIVVGIIRGGD